MVFFHNAIGLCLVHSSLRKVTLIKYIRKRSLERLEYSLWIKTYFITHKGYKISILKLNTYNIFSKVWQLKHL